MVPGFSDRGGLPALQVRDAGSDGGTDRCRLIVGSTADGAPAASLRLCDRDGKLHGRAVRIAGIGALSTPPEQRGRRYGAALVAAVLDRARQDGFQLALLFSDIGAGYFARLGFRPLPGEESSCVTSLPAPWPAEPGWVDGADPPLGVPGLRRAGPEDLDSLVRLHEACQPPAALSLTRDRRWWEQLQLQAGAGGRPRRTGGETVVWLIDDGAGPRAFAVLREEAGALRWLDHGAGPGGEGGVVDLFWAAITTARRRGLPRLAGWSLPRGAAGTTLYPIARRVRRRPLVMALPLESRLSLAGLRASSDCRIGELDRF